MAKLFKKSSQVSADKHQNNIYSIVLEKMQTAINNEIEDPNGIITAEDLGRLQKVLYG